MATGYSPRLHLHVPFRFESVVSKHILKNIAGGDYDVPLILGIHGSPGEGKTRQCELTLRKMGVDWIVISGGELENQLAGRPGELIRDRYLEASKRFDRSTGKICALLINDFDTGIGIWSSQNEKAVFQYTVNLQNVYATLMNIVDHPLIIDGVECNRTPIIITGNNFDVLYEPLVRDGRMVKFRWQPTDDEKSTVIHAIFEGLDLPQQALQEFAMRHMNETIAFFAHVKSTLMDQSIDEWLHGREMSNVIRDFLLESHSVLMLKSISLDQLESAAAKVKAEKLTTGRFSDVVK